MFWGTFSYDKKGPCHIWTSKTAQEKRVAEAELEKMNATWEEECQEKWQLLTGICCLGLRNKPRKAPVWKFTKKTGKLVQQAKAGGIDWYQYGQVILMGKLLPFAQECKQSHPDTIIQEDKVPSHTHHSQKAIYSSFDIQQLLWPGNSPDLNAIEPCWPFLKWTTTKYGTPRSRDKMKKAWLKAWKDLDQSQIQ